MAEVRFRRIDDSNRHDHYHLSADDRCIFLYEYTSGEGYNFSDTNSLISNLKKKPSESWKNGYSYKAKAIGRCAADLAGALNPEWLKAATLIPAPSSKADGHPDFDDRLVRILDGLGLVHQIDARPIVKNTKSRDAAHESSIRPTVEELTASYTIDTQLAAQAEVKRIGIFDDVLTAGTTFRAMSSILSDTFKGVPITGIFIARRAIQNPFAALDLSDLEF